LTQPKCNQARRIITALTLMSLCIQLGRRIDMSHWNRMSAALVALAAIAVVPAVAADLPPRLPPPVAVFVPPPFTWAGFYIGANVGGAWAHGNIVDTATGASFGTRTPSGFIGGGQIGYNFQAGGFVFGVEGFFDGIASNNRNTSNILTGANGDSFQATANTPWVASVAGRLGFTGGANWLLYAKGGGAWVGYHATVTDLTTAATVSTSSSRSGWLAGAGIEWAFSPSWSAKLEYDYIGLSTGSIAPIFATERFSVNKPNVQMLTVGLNYLFH
jgi:outer membrane immunogenic protein